MQPCHPRKCMREQELEMNKRPNAGLPKHCWIYNHHKMKCLMRKQLKLVQHHSQVKLVLKGCSEQVPKEESALISMMHCTKYRLLYVF